MCLCVFLVCVLRILITKYRVSQKLLCSKVPRTTLQFFLQQMLDMSPKGLKTVHQWRSEKACPDVSSGP
jgi:hypothetical protein